MRGSFWPLVQRRDKKTRWLSAAYHFHPRFCRISRKDGIVQEGLVVDLKKYTLDVDLKQGVVPISKAASSLAALIKRSRANHQPIIVTQKGYPTGVILDVELFTALRQLADLHLQQEEEGVNDGAGAPPEN